MYTIGKVAKKFAISRSTLIYYDSIGLLSPNSRSSANYRLYSESDLEKMEKISHFRETGMSLESIANILDLDNNNIRDALETRLFIINDEIHKLRCQQYVITQALKSNKLSKHTKIMTKEKWVSLLSAIGLDDTDMEKWHIEFERMSPEAHQDFLESLGIHEAEIISIRKQSGKE